MHDYNDKQDKKLSANVYYYKYTKIHKLLDTRLVTRKNWCLTAPTNTESNSQSQTYSHQQA